jgi:hypothetical protein
VARTVISLTIVNLRKGPTVQSDEQVSLPSFRDVSQAEWDRLAGARVWFGHQSVGGNLLDGIREVIKNDPAARLNIVETDRAAAMETPAFGHARIGRNRDPISKIEAFVHLMDASLGGNVNIAFFKFCYVDIDENTDVGALFARYRDAMARLKGKYPGTLFAHVTVPLRAMQTGPKTWAKHLLSRPVGGEDDNARRHAFNERLRKEYSGREPLFDLAALEATAPDGQRVLNARGGLPYYALLSTYTDDGGHLNETGRRRIAEQLLIFLARLAK